MKIVALLLSLFAAAPAYGCCRCLTARSEQEERMVVENVDFAKYDQLSKAGKLNERISVLETGSSPSKVYALVGPKKDLFACGFTEDQMRPEQFDQLLN